MGIEFYVISFLVVFFALAIYVLYLIGKEVKTHEVKFNEMVSEKDAKKRLVDLKKKYGRKRSPTLK